MTATVSGGAFTIDAKGSIAMVERAIQETTMMQLLGASANPAFELDPAKLMQDILTHRPQLEQLVGRASIWHVPGLEADEAGGIARSVLGAINDDAVDRLTALTADSIRRLVRLIDEIRRGRATGRRTGAIEPAEVDAAWRRIYSPPSKRRPA